MPFPKGCGLRIGFAEMVAVFEQLVGKDGGEMLKRHEELEHQRAEGND